MENKSKMADRWLNLIIGTLFLIGLVSATLIGDTSTVLKIVILLGLGLLASKMYVVVPEGKGLLLTRAFGGFSEVWLPPGINFTWYPILKAEKKHLFSTQRREVRRKLAVTSKDGYKIYTQSDILIIISTFDPYTQIAENEGGESQVDDIAFRSVEKVAKDLASKEDGDTIVKDYPEKDLSYEDLITLRLLGKNDPDFSMDIKRFLAHKSYIVPNTGNIIHQIDIPDMDYSPELRKDIDTNLGKLKTAQTKNTINDISLASLKKAASELKEIVPNAKEEEVLQAAMLNNDVYDPDQYKKHVVDVNIGGDKEVINKVTDTVKAVTQNPIVISNLTNGLKGKGKGGKK